MKFFYKEPHLYHPVLPEMIGPAFGWILSCALRDATHSKSHVKTVTRHVWKGHMERVEDIRHTRGNKEIHGRRRETIERYISGI